MESSLQSSLAEGTVLPGGALEGAPSNIHYCLWCTHSHQSWEYGDDCSHFASWDGKPISIVDFRPRGCTRASGFPESLNKIKGDQQLENDLGAESMAHPGARVHFCLERY